MVQGVKAETPSMFSMECSLGLPSPLNRLAGRDVHTLHTHWHGINNFINYFNHHNSILVLFI